MTTADDADADADDADADDADVDEPYLLAIRSYERFIGLTQTQAGELSSDLGLDIQYRDANAW